MPFQIPRVQIYAGLWDKFLLLDSLWKVKGASVDGEIQWLPKPYQPVGYWQEAFAEVGSVMQLTLMMPWVAVKPGTELSLSG